MNRYCSFLSFLSFLFLFLFLFFFFFFSFFFIEISIDKRNTSNPVLSKLILTIWEPHVFVCPHSVSPSSGVCVHTATPSAGWARTGQTLPHTHSGCADVLCAVCSVLFCSALLCSVLFCSGWSALIDMMRWVGLGSVGLSWPSLFLSFLSFLSFFSFFFYCFYYFCQASLNHCSPLPFSPSYPFIHSIPEFCLHDACASDCASRCAARPHADACPRKDTLPRRDGEGVDVTHKAVRGRKHCAREHSELWLWIVSTLIVGVCVCVCVINGMSCAVAEYCYLSLFGISIVV